MTCKHKVESFGFEDVAFSKMSAEVKKTGPRRLQLIGQRFEFLKREIDGLVERKMLTFPGTLVQIMSFFPQMNYLNLYFSQV